jgi:hypothetical protein
VRWWLASAIVAFVLIEARTFVDTPQLSETLQTSPNPNTVLHIDERASDLVIGMGLTSRLFIDFADIHDTSRFVSYHRKPSSHLKVKNQ